MQPTEARAANRLSEGQSAPREHPILAAALELAAMGYPCTAIVANGKNPATEHGKDDATTDPARLRAMLKPHHNLAVAWPAGGLAVDLDVPKDEHKEPLPGAREYAAHHGAELERRFPELARAPRWISRSEGLVYLLRRVGDPPLPGRVRAVDLPDGGGIDLRGEGGTYTLVPPSHIKGSAYRWDATRPVVPIDQLPVVSPELRAYLMAGRGGNGAPELAFTAGAGGAARVLEEPIEPYVNAIIPGSQARLAAVRSGRNDACYQAALNIGRWIGGLRAANHDLLSEREAYDALHAAMVENKDYAEDPRKAENTIRNGLRDGIKSSYAVQIKPRPPRAILGRDPTDPMLAPSPDIEAPPYVDGTDQAPTPEVVATTPLNAATTARMKVKSTSRTRPGVAKVKTSNNTDTPPYLVAEPDLQLSRYPFTDAGNAQRLIYRVAGLIRHAPGVGWLMWNGRSYDIDVGELVLRHVIQTMRATHATSTLLSDQELGKTLGKHARASESTGRLRAMLDIARVDPRIHVDPADLDADPWLLNCENCMIDLRTGERKDHDRAAFCTKIAPTEYHPDAAHDALTRLLELLDRDGRAEYLRGIAGQALTGHVAKSFYVWSGDANTAKSTLADAITAALGPYAITIEPNTLLVNKYGHAGGGARADLVALRGARFGVAAELPNGGRLDADIIKRSTGGDHITARSPYSPTIIRFRPTHTVVVHTNGEPRADYTDPGMRQRLHVTPFLVKPDKPDRRIRYALEHDPEARAATLAWAVPAAAQWHASGLEELDPPSSVKERTTQYWEQQDPIAPWAADCLVFEDDPKTTTPVADLKRHYENWCDRNGADYVASSIALGRWIATQAKKHPGVEPEKTGGQRGWKGVRIKLVEG